MAIRLLILLSFAHALSPAEAELIEVRRIWDAAPHSAFTDLLRFEGQWFCVFREGKEHLSTDGAIRVLTSRDGTNWISTARLTSTNADLRDPKITITPKNELLLSGAGAMHPPSPHRHLSFAWSSSDGTNWSAPVTIGDPNVWLWGIAWRRGTAYSIGYDTAGERFVRLYSSADGRSFEPLVPTLFTEGRPNESSLVFQPDETALCLLRRDGAPGTGKLGSARPPYKEWQWKDLGVKIGGPHMIRLPDGRLVACVRLYDGGARTSLAWVKPDSGALIEFLKLPSGGDTSYAGLAWHENVLWVSYYSSHEARASIYIAKVKL